MHRITRWDICSTSLRSSNLITAGLAPFVTDWDSVGHGVAAPLTELTSSHRATLSSFWFIFKHKPQPSLRVWLFLFSKNNKSKEDKGHMQLSQKNKTKKPHWFPKGGGSHKTTLFWKLFWAASSSISCADEQRLKLWGKMLTQSQTARANTHTCSIMDTSWQHLGGKQRTLGEREGWLQPSRGSDSAETKLQPATWIITGQHWATMVRSEPQVHSHTQTHTWKA